MIATKPNACVHPAPPNAWPKPTEVPAVVAASTNQRRKVKTWPALIRFFQSSAIAGWPVGFRVNGARLLLGFLPEPRQVPARTAATLSAN
jgi:hypothetical protein